MTILRSIAAAAFAVFTSGLVVTGCSDGSSPTGFVSKAANNPAAGAPGTLPAGGGGVLDAVAFDASQLIDNSGFCAIQGVGVYIKSSTPLPSSTTIDVRIIQGTGNPQVVGQATAVGQGQTFDFAVADIPVQPAGVQIECVASNGAKSNKITVGNIVIADPAFDVTKPVNILNVANTPPEANPVTFEFPQATTTGFQGYLINVMFHGYDFNAGTILSFGIPIAVVVGQAQPFVAGTTTNVTLSFVNTANLPAPGQDEFYQVAVMTVDSTGWCTQSTSDPAGITNQNPVPNTWCFFLTQ